jgi:hypothetical protein
MVLSSGVDMTQTPDINMLWNSRPGIATGSGGITPIPTPGSRQWTIGYQAGRSLPDFAMRKGMLRPLRPLIDSLGTNNVGSGLLGAAAGGVIGAGAALAGGGSVGRGALVGAGTGMAGMLLASLYAQNRLRNTRFYQEPRPAEPWRDKVAFYAGTPDGSQAIMQKLMSDYSLSSADKSTLQREVGKLNHSQLGELSRVVGGAVGAGIGALIARYLLKMGVGGTALLAIAGAAIGGQFSSLRNAYGQRSDPGHDMFGQPRFV